MEYLINTYRGHEEELTLARQLADAGADIIIGNHAHHSQPIEWLNDGKTICFYALGHMLSAQTYEGICTWEELNTGIAASLVMEKTVEPDRTVNKQIRDVRADLIFTYNTDDCMHMFSVFYKDLTDDMMMDHVAWYQWHIDHVIHGMDPSIQTGI